MVVKKAKAYWSFIKTPDEAGKFRVTFTVDDKTYKDLMTEIENCAEESRAELKDLEWIGSYKKTEDGEHQFSAKANSEFTSKKGETIQFELPVYNIKAQRLKSEEIPMIKNGAIVNLVVEPYYIEYKKKKGVMLGLRSVQLIEYEEYTGEGYNPYEDESEDCPFEKESEATHNSNENEDIFN